MRHSRIRLVWVDAGLRKFHGVLWLWKAWIADSQRPLFHVGTADFGKSVRQKWGGFCP